MEMRKQIHDVNDLSTQMQKLKLNLFSIELVWVDLMRLMQASG